MAEVAVWSYGLAAVAFAFFALYIFFAWRGALPGGVLFAAVGISSLWAACSAVAARGDVARGGARAANSGNKPGGNPQRIGTLCWQSATIE